MAVRAGGEPPDVRTLRGWRAELAGNDLLDLLEGRMRLSVEQTEGTRRLRIQREG
jgi:hypothetical protein